MKSRHVCHIFIFLLTYFPFEEKKCQLLTLIYTNMQVLKNREVVIVTQRSDVIFLLSMALFDYIFIINSYILMLKKMKIPGMLQLGNRGFA